VNPAAYIVEVEVLGYMRTDVPSGVEAKNLWGLKTKHSKADDKSAGKILVEFDRIK